MLNEGNLLIRIDKIQNKVTSALAYYPIGFYLGFALLIVSGFLYWAQVDLGWKFDWVQLQRWISTHMLQVLIVFSGLLGLVLIGSAVAYRQVVDLSKQDYVLWLHQKATRVLFPVFSPLHDWIRLRSRFYHWWHAQSVSNITHYFLLAIAVLGLAKTTASYVSQAQASHGCSDAVTITVNTTWSTNQCHGDVIIRNGATLTINGGITADLSSLSVGSDSPAENGFITAKGDTLNNLGVVLNVDGTVYVRASSSISANTQGYLGGTSSGNGAGTGGGTGGSGTNAGGGAYGGNGGNASGGNIGGTGYGTIESPALLGSGGGAGGADTGGNGGGAIKINAATSTVTVNGSITANGGNGSAGCCSGAAGGSGGSIWIIANTLAGSGTITANGGTNGSRTEPGAGGGGRIDADCSTNSSTATVQTYGGNQTSGQRGGAGTINLCGVVTAANDSSSTSTSPNTTSADTSLTFTSLLVKDYARLKMGSSLTTFSTGTTTIQNNSRIEISNTATVWSGGALTIQTGTNTVNIPYNIVTEPAFSSMDLASGTLNHDAHTSTDLYRLIFNVSGNVTLTGNVTLDSKGFSGGAGITNGNGTGGGVGANPHGGGAGYGGVGGAANSGGAGGTTYGSITAPNNLGSGGGGGGNASTGTGGSGGGAIKISSSGTITVAGTVSANGGNGSAGCCNGGGGGSGGSVWLSGATISGSGTVRANGGTGGSRSEPGGGSGGRVSITCTTNSASLTTQAFGGTQTTGGRGAAGTLYLCGSTDLTIANDTGYSGASPNTPIGTNLTLTSFTVKDYAQVTINESITLSGGTTILKNNSKLTLGGNSTIWSGGALTIGTDASTNTINVPKTITTKPLFSTITVGSGTLQHDANTTTHTYSLIMKSTGNIDVTGTISTNGKGYSGGGTGSSGSGTGGGAGNTTHGGGGGYGASGGTSSTGSAGGSSYGSALLPVDLGSGGGGGSGGGTGGAGGGAVQLESGATITISGTISSNGSNGASGCCNGGGGGAGGSALLIADVIAGNGTVTANGGGNPTHTGAGCGAGGRIGRHYRSNTFSGTLTALKGTSCTSGTDGTTQTVGPVTHFTVSGHPSSITAGTSGSVTVTALDASNNQNYGYTKTVTFSSPDGQAVLPGNYPFTISDNGTHTFTNGITLKTAGTQSIVVDQSDDGSIDGSQTGIIVNPGSASTLSVSGISDPVTAGTASNVSVTAKDAYNNTATGYTGTVTFSSNDGQAVLPSNYAFVGGDSGTKTFTNGVTMKTSGERSVTVTDTVTGSITGTQSAISVNPAAANNLVFTGVSSPTIAGALHSPVVTVKDQYSNTVTSYGGTITFNSTDVSATVPGNYTFTGGDAGVKTFTSGIKLITTGNQSVTVSDGTLSSNISNINVTAAQPTKLKINNVTSPLVSGSSTSATVTVQDEFSNTVVGYTGTIAFSSTDTAATLPANYTYTVGDAGIHVFSNAIKFATTGSQSLTATDTVDNTIKGTLAGITVTATATIPGNSNSNSNSNTGGNSNNSGSQSPTVPPSLTIVLIEPSQGTFFGTVEQEVNGLPLIVSVSGTITGNQINGSVSGTYDGNPVLGSITGTIKGRDITSAIITLFSSTDPLFNLSVVVGGTITTPDKPKTKPVCKLRGSLELTIDGKLFKGDVQLTVDSDGTITGRANGFLDDDKVFGTFTSNSIEGRIIDGQVTLSAQNGKKAPTTGDIIGNVKEGEIALSNAENCKFKTSIIVDTDGDGESDGDGTGTVVIDDPVSEDDTVTGPVTGTINTETAKEDVIVTGTFSTLVADIVIKPSNIEMRTIQQNDLISGAAVVVSGLTLLPVLPAVQSVLLTSSTRGFTFIHWFFFGYTPRKRRKFWGIIRDRITKTPVSGVLVRLVDVSSGQVVSRYRTDKSGRYGFLVDALGDYYITITDPLYEDFRTKQFSVNSLSQPIITGDIELRPADQRRQKLLRKTYIWLTVIKVFGVLHWPLLVGGTIFSVSLLIDHPTTFRMLIVTLYSVLWLSKLLGYRRERHFGLVTDNEGKPLVRAVVQLTTESENITAHIHSTVTDKEGRFVLLVKPGVYDVIVAKEGYKTRHGAVIADEANMTIRLDHE